MADLTRAPAGRLARRGAARGPVREFLTFLLGDDAFGVDLARIKEILNLPPITPVPRAAASVMGICSVRGLLVTVMDLRLRLGLETRPRTRRARILLVTTDSGDVVGLLVDEVRHVLRLSEDELELAPSLGGDLAEHVLGVGRPRGEFVVLLDLGAVVEG